MHQPLKHMHTHTHTHTFFFCSFTISLPFHQTSSASSITCRTLTQTKRHTRIFKIVSVNACITHFTHKLPIHHNAPSCRYHARHEASTVGSLVMCSHVLILWMWTKAIVLTKCDVVLSDQLVYQTHLAQSFSVWIVGSFSWEWGDFVDGTVINFYKFSVSFKIQGHLNKKKYTIEWSQQHPRTPRPKPNYCNPLLFRADLISVISVQYVSVIEWPDITIYRVLW